MESNVKQTDALKDGVLVHVDSVPTGNKSGCICTKCGAELIAKNQGTVYAHHFAHAVDNKCAGETPYHIKAKEIIKRRKQIIVPWYYDFPITKYLDDGEVDNFSIAPNKIFTLDEYKNLSKYDKMLDFEKVVIEDTIPGSRYKSDLRALQNSNWINIEIVVTHSLKNPDSKDKMKFINDKKLDTLMITIKSDDIKDPDTKDFENYVLNTANREWVFNNDIPIILKQLEGMHKTFVDQYVSKYYDNAKAKSAEKENLWARIHKKSQDSKKMISDKEIFLETFKTLSIEEKLQVFVSHSREKMKLFIDKREDTNRLINLQLLSLAPFLLLPSEIRRTVSRSYLDAIIEKNDNVIDGWRNVKDDYTINKYYPFDDHELVKDMYAKALQNKELKKRYATDMTIIKKEMELIVHLFKEKGLTVSEIGDFFYDVFYHFNFEKCRNHDPGTYQKKVYMMTKRL